MVGRDGGAPQGGLNEKARVETVCSCGDSGLMLLVDGYPEVGGTENVDGGNQFHLLVGRWTRGWGDG